MLSICSEIIFFPGHTYFLLRNILTCALSMPVAEKKLNIKTGSRHIDCAKRARENRVREMALDSSSLIVFADK